jgi:ubiquinone/menaquinone biosynthesis C-methylase UbiE
VLTCTGCRCGYPITRGIPRFVPEDNYASSFGYQWNRFRREQIDSINGMTQSERRFRTETAWPDGWDHGKWILDAGCGAGRFLEVATRSPHAQVVGIDISNAIDAAAQTVAGRPNAHLVQASILNLPFRPRSFDGVYSIGVIQHTPDPAGAVRSLSRVVRDGGRIAVTIYERRRFTPLYSKYWLRPLTRRMPPRTLLTLIQAAMPVAFAVTELLFRIPVLGRLFQFLIPVANYVYDRELTISQRYRWAILDTFDMLSPAYDIPQREADVRHLLAEAGLADVTRLPNPGLNLVAVRPKRQVTV